MRIPFGPQDILRELKRLAPRTQLRAHCRLLGSARTLMRIASIETNIAYATRIAPRHQLSSVSSER